MVRPQPQHAKTRSPRDRALAAAIGAVAGYILSPPDLRSIALYALAGIAVAWMCQSGVRWLLRLGGVKRLCRRLRQRGQPHPHMRFAFTALGRLAKCEGVVLPAHIDYVDHLIKRLGFSSFDRSQAITWFREGKTPAPNWPMLGASCQNIIEDKQLLDDMVLESMCALSLISPARNTRPTLLELADALGLSEAHVDATFVRLKHRQQAGRQSPNRDARALLGIDDAADQNDIKLAYRRQVARWHPDRMPEASAAEVKQAELKLNELRDAFELLSAGD